jgi:hypothetical protein
MQVGNWTRPLNLVEVELTDDACVLDDLNHLITATTAPSGTAIGFEKYADSKLMFNSIF